jgi:heme/copper-type cytochrome/quinol oxidase subunit 2
MTLLGNILDFVATIGSIVIILMLVVVGFQFVTAQGAPAEIAKARSALLWTVVGGLILLGAKAISLGIQATVQALSTGG